MSGVLVHEWIEKAGGAEKVVDCLSEMMPSADIVCLWNDAPDRYGSRVVRESALSSSRLRHNKALCVPVAPLVWRRQRNAGYTWALISTHLFAHHARFSPGTPDFEKLLYVHTPARYLWATEYDPRGRKPLVRLAGPALRALDRVRAKEATLIAANSSFVADRIADSWGLESTVIHPPVEVSRIQEVSDWRTHLTDEELDVLAALPSGFLLGASRMVEYKRLDIVIRAGADTGMPTVIVGTGPDEQRLRDYADSIHPSTIFLGRVSDALLYALFQACSAFVFPPVEDFGIIPVEAMAAGAVVVGNRVGGVRETVIDGVTGALADMRDRSSVKYAVDRALSCDSALARTRAAEFSTDVFKKRIVEWAGYERFRQSGMEPLYENA
ncbi:glycosyltransferase [Rhodococcus koreensis]|uniref:glycosyltransferase n=1 Tax=Rhodococcus koreensis TaxID=99653 RepID=UPI00197EEA08|nr:glycosyltransferase [Rhodococcus koreensis]QSE87076.1 glycosyltransferase [Rhodococcus koreensis]